jgi:hypothetical protein
VITIDEMRMILSELVDELPTAFFDGLNGGIIVVPEQKRHPEGIKADKPLFIMAEYTSSFQMGRQIVFYYGSFQTVFRHISPESAKPILRRILRHEFRHHVEGLGNLKDLEIEDKERIKRYLADDH